MSAVVNQDLRRGNHQVTRKNRLRHSDEFRIREPLLTPLLFEFRSVSKAFAPLGREFLIRREALEHPGRNDETLAIEAVSVREQTGGDSSSA